MEYVEIYQPSNVYLPITTAEHHPLAYCKFGNFCENFIFTNSINTHICDIKNSRQGHDLPISENDRVIRQFVRILFSRNFAYAKFPEIKTLAKISEFTVNGPVHEIWVLTCIYHSLYIYV